MLERLIPGRALRVLLEADVEPDRAVEGCLLVQKDVGELGLEGVGVRVGGEVAALAAPAGDRAGDAGDHLLDRVLALVGADPSAEVLLGDDVRRVLRPGLRELDAALLEDRVVRVADDRVAELPLDLVERVAAGGRMPALAGQAPSLNFVGLCSAFRHPSSPHLLGFRRLSARFSG
jgi:hypothetical protein